MAICVAVRVHRFVAATAPALEDLSNSVFQIEYRPFDTNFLWSLQRTSYDFDDGCNEVLCASQSPTESSMSILYRAAHAGCMERCWLTLFRVIRWCVSSVRLVLCPPTCSNFCDRDSRACAGKYRTITSATDSVWRKRYVLAFKTVGNDKVVPLCQALVQPHRTLQFKANIWVLITGPWGFL